MQRNKKQNGIKNAKYEVAELLRKGNDESARIKVRGKETRTGEVGGVGEGTGGERGDKK